MRGVSWGAADIGSGDVFRRLGTTRDQTRSRPSGPDKKGKTVNTMTDKGLPPGQTIGASADQAQGERRDVAGADPVLGTVESRRYNLLGCAGLIGPSWLAVSEGWCAGTERGPTRQRAEGAEAVT